MYDKHIEPYMLSLVDRTLGKEHLAPGFAQLIVNSRWVKEQSDEIMLCATKARFCANNPTVVRLCNRRAKTLRMKIVAWKAFVFRCRLNACFISLLDAQAPHA